MATYATLTVDPDALLENREPGSDVVVKITTNTGGVIFDTATGKAILANWSEKIAGGAATTFSLPTTDGATNPTDFQYMIVLNYIDTTTRDRKDHWSSGWVSFTADATLAGLVAEQYVPPTWMTTNTATLQTYVDAGQAAATTAAASATSAAASASVASTLVTTDLNTTDGQSFALVTDPNSLTGGALTNRFVRVYTPKEYGAVCDGVADDTAAVQACLAAADSANGIAYIPKLGAEYRLTDTLTISNPMTVRCDPMAVMHWTGLAGDTPGILIDYGNVTYNLGSYEFPILNGPIANDLTAMTGTALRVANGDIIQTKVNYVINWKVGIHHIADISNSENCHTRFEVMDRVETGILLEAATGRYLDLLEMSGNTIGISKWPIRFKTTGSGEVSDSKINLQQVWQEIGGGTCIYGEGAAGINRNIVEVPYVRSESTGNTPGAAFKEKWIGGDQTVNGEAGFFFGNQNTFRFGGIPSNTDAACPVRIKVSGFDNNLVSLNRDQESAAGITLSATQGEANFNSGLPLAANKFVAEVSVPATAAGTVLTYYAYSQLLTSEFGTAIKVLPTNAWGGHFDIWAEDNSATNNREIVIQIRMRDTTTFSWTARFLIEVD